MKHSLIPVALGMAATIAVPLQAGATTSPSSEPESNDITELPVSSEASPAASDSDNSPGTSSELLLQTNAGDMPVLQESSYTESSGALNFEPPPSRASRDPAPPEIASRPPQPPSQEKPSPPESPVKRDFGGAKPVNSGGAKPVNSGEATKSATSKTNDFFEGGSDSLVARTVGAAEGTRTADGGKTQNYHGHTDPGNGVWNRGTFSYQFGNTENLTPDEADRRQLAKIKRIYESVMVPKAEQHGVAPLTVEEEINGIDLINQAPLTVTEEGGYIERLAEAKQKGLSGEEAILNARIWSFWDSGKGGWDAPGLRAYDDISKEESIRRDQDRRMGMISKALAAYEKENGSIARIPSASPSEPSQTASRAGRGKDNQGEQQKNAISDAIIFGEKPTTRG